MKTTETLLDLLQPDIAYLVGLLQTDGTHEGSLDGKGRVALELAERDDSVLYALSDLLPFYTSIGHRTRTTNFARNYSTSTLRFYNQEVRREMVRVGVPTGKKTTTISPPTVPFDKPAYLRGLLDGDGSVGFTGRGWPFVSLSTASPQTAQFFCDCVKEITGVTRIPSGNTRDGQFNPMVANVPAALLAAWVWPNAGVLGIDRKRESAMAVSAWKPPTASASRYGVPRKSWTDEQDEILLNLSGTDAALALDRTVKSIYVRRWRLKQTDLNQPNENQDLSKGVAL